MTDDILRLEGVSRAFGGLMAVGDVSFSVSPGAIFGLIGPNGAGKTTLFNLVSGITPVSSGAITFLGQDIRGVPPHKVAGMGMARTFQNIRLFSGMSVLDNVRAPMQAFSRTGLLQDLLGLAPSRAQERQILDTAMDLLELVGLKPKARDLAASLPYGERRRLEIARALALRPRLLLLDEPAAGLNLAEKAELKDFIRNLRDRFDLTVLIIEHHVPLVMGLCDRLAVLNFGRLICQGSPDEVRSDPCVIDAYLGESHAAPRT